ncbi:prolyl oligopeptidase family serine peptidase [Methylobacterium sp. E-065]|uniref:prolyl oligopeptidase family serine peptidase n=1 Tax=Methylobacterium sp. E-065 TaxID=2836583 RepID=UPI001FBAF06F|nr:prolyl oligopeptidase family serine peptidase [Methylobacterium sp. E-065]MCJ2019530.1 prolyl oligopeptidase family serine peptidase [Methylobacterium sp. E-065]
MSASTVTPFDPRPTRAKPDDDPYLWLEEIDGVDAVAWVDARTAETLARYGDAAFIRGRDLARGLLDRPDRIPFVSRRGGLLYNFWRDDEHPRGLWRRTDEATYRAGDPVWEVLLDLDALAARESEDWVWSGSSPLRDSYDRALLRLSRGGGDAVVLREFDLPTRTFVADGFTLPEAKGGAVWLDHDTLLLSSALGAGMATHSGYARTVRLWRRGADLLDAPVLFETAGSSMSVWGAADHQTGMERLTFTEQLGFFDASLHIGDRGGARMRLDLPTHAGVQLHRDHLSIRLRRPWNVDGVEHVADTVLTIALTDFLAGKRAFEVLWLPGERLALQGVFWSAGRLIVSALDDLKPVYTVYELGPEGWMQRPLPGLPVIGNINVWPLDDHAETADGSLLATVQDPVTPTTLLIFSPALDAPAVLRRMPPAFDAQGLRVTRHEAVSADGTRVPYVQTGPDVTNGDAPVHLTAYGGFRVSMLPVYRGVLGKLWLERGGTAVTANIRGGGEFGTDWHEAGRREGKARAHEDFAAVAADLVARGVTRPSRIAAEGGSNGGLLIANMLTRFPERFGALFCTIPLIDMRRYSKLLAGASWVAEYGDPDDPADWAHLGGISAYHVAVAGRPYPPILLATSRRDDRVHPGHARKMAAKLRALGYAVSFYEPAAGGHGYGKDNAETAAFMALGLNFLRRSIGWSAPEVLEV